MHTLQSQTRYRLKAVMMLLQAGASYSSIENVRMCARIFSLWRNIFLQIAVESFFRSQQLQTFSRTLSAELVKDAGRVVKAIRYNSLSVRFILIGKAS